MGICFVLSAAKKGGKMVLWNGMMEYLDGLFTLSTKVEQSRVESRLAILGALQKYS